jgi:hypothetical protein
MSCVQRVQRTLEESEGMTQVTFDPQTETFLLVAQVAFRFDDVAKRVRRAGQAHDARLGLTDGPVRVLTRM